ncbi:hypothetical protein HN873_056214 [Arachis hypogaea]
MNGGVDIYLAIIPKKEVAKIKDKSTDQVFSMLDTSRLYHAVATCERCTSHHYHTPSWKGTKVPFGILYRID